MKRKICPLNSKAVDEYLAFAKSAQEKEADLIFKPVDGSCGKGIFILPFNDERIFDTAYLLQKNDYMVVEEVLKNHHEIRALCPDTLNTIRIPVLIKNDSVKILGAYLRMGRMGTDTDNFSSGGIICEIDVETGIVISHGINKKSQTFSFHPDTGIPLVGFRVPFWEESKRLAIEAAYVTPTVYYSSWDIAVLEDGPIIIEGNYAGDVDLQQAPMNKGKRYLFADYLPKRHLYFGYTRSGKHTISKEI